MTATQGVLGVVILLVLTYVVRCLHLILSDDPRNRLRGLKGDIDKREASGRNLDWAYYSDEAQRKHEDLREHLRNYSTISLATGVGGTMGALALYLLAGDASQGDALGRLLREMGWALLASGTGVLGNLAILWGLLPWANRRFDPALYSFLDALRMEETKQRAQVETLSQTVPEIIGDRLSKELRSAIARVPRMFEQLGETATVLGEAADKLDANVTRLTSATATLVSSTSTLNRMPKDLDTVLGRALEGLSDEAAALRNDLRTWESERRSAAVESHARLQSVIESASSQHHEAADNLNEATRAVASAVNNAAAKLAETTQAVRESVEDLPGLVASAVEGSGESLGRKFSDAVAPHVTSFRDGVTDGLDKTIEWQNAVTEHLNEARRQQGRAIHELVTRTTDIVTSVQGLPGAVADGVEKVSDKLGREFGHQARQHVAQLQSTLHEDAKQLRRELQRHENHLLNTTMRELREVSEQLLKKTVHDLEGISEKLGAVLDGFPEHVAAVNTRLDDTEGELRDIVARIEETSSALRTAHDKTGDMLAGLRSSTEGLEQVIRQLAEGNTQAIRELTEAVRRPRRMGWWRRFRRRSHEGTPSATPGQGAA